MGVLAPDNDSAREVALRLSKRNINVVLLDHDARIAPIYGKDSDAFRLSLFERVKAELTLRKNDSTDMAAADKAQRDFDLLQKKVSLKHL